MTNLWSKSSVWMAKRPADVIASRTEKREKIHVKNRYTQCHCHKNNLISKVMRLFAAHATYIQQIKKRALGDSDILQLVSLRQQ